MSQFKHRPLTAQERDERGKYYKEGLVDFVVKSVTESVSQKTSKNMLVIELRLWDSEGKEGIIKDYITESMNWKTEDFLESIGLSEEAKKEYLDIEKFEGREGRGRVKYKKDDMDKWQIQFNYIMPSVKPEPVKQAAEQDVINDDIPF